MLMEVDKHERKLLETAIGEWTASGKLSEEQASDLNATLVNKHTERQQVAQYFFFIALFCTLMAFGAIFLNEKLLEKIKHYFSWNDLSIAVITATLSGLWFGYTARKRRRMNPAAYEVNMVLGGLSVLTSLLYLCKEFHIDATYTAFLSLSLPIIAALSFALRSRSLWIGTILLAVGWFGSLSTWQNEGNLFLGMNYPMRYTVFGLLIIAVSLLQTQIKLISFAQRITYTAGLILFFLGLWGISIFGNYSTLVGWQQVRQIHVVAYSIVFAAASAISFFLGVKYKDDLARDFGVLFLLINLYTRYFEYFWDTMNKGIFFTVLAITFGLLGTWLERKRKAHPNPAEGEKM